ncbi:transcription elongation factor GreA [Candidatus Parcubacteria bacterium]|nr:transcription elongation factor GreA [Candidatus Parcubacteria bacterium]
MTKYLTQEGLKKIKKELEYLEKVIRKEVSEDLKHTSSQGDLKENAGYHIAKEKQGFVEGKIKELREIIAQAKVIEKKENGRSQIGSFVSLKLEGRKEKFQIVETEEVDILKGKISFNSPLGGALLGKKKGDIIEVDAPQGKKKYKVIDIG